MVLRFGTCSWTEKTLLESREFYPKDIRTAEQRLKYYANMFDTVEVDSVYYGIPAPNTAQLWADRTTKGFTFHIKVYGAFTRHPINPVTLPRDIRDSLSDEEKAGTHIYINDSTILEALADRLKEAIDPLLQAGKLGVILFQFPPWFQYRSSNFDYILRCKELMQGYRLAVEFRHFSWFEPKRFASILNFLREHNLTYVTVDEPRTDNNAVPFKPHATTETAYFRFHGRNVQNWAKKGIETALRFAYHYSDDELEGFIPSIRAVEESAEEAFMMFNNCYRNFAIRNAQRLRELLR